MKPLHETIPKEMSKQEFIRKCAIDFGYFCENILDLKMTDFHVRWAQMFHTQPRSAIMAARRLGKTTILGVAYPVWYMLFNKIAMKNHFDQKPARILIVSNTMHESKRIIREQKQAINANELLYNTLYPSNTREGKLWTKMEYMTKNGCTVTARAFSENIRGIGAHRLLMNESSLFRDQFVYERAILPIVGSTGNLMSIGTPMSEVDVLANQFRSPEFVTDKVPVMVKGKSVWQWKYPMSAIEKAKRELGPLGFAREMMCEIVSDESQAIDNKALAKCMDKELRLQTTLLRDGSPGEDGKVPNRVCGIDLAMSAHGDYSVAIVLEETPKGKWLIRHIDRKRGLHFSGHMDWIQTIYESFLPTKIEIDKSQFGQALIDELRMNRSVPCNPFTFTPANRNEAVAKMIQLIDQHRLIIPRNPDDMITINLTNEMVHELSGLAPTRTNAGVETFSSTTAHDDIAMAMAIAASLTSSSSMGGVYIKKW